MSKFKVGDRVRFLTNCAGKKNEILTISRISGNTYGFKESTTLCTFPRLDFELAERSMKVGDILTDKDGCTTKILAIAGGDFPVYGLSEYNDHDHFEKWGTAKDLEGYGLKLQPEITEKTVAEVEKELNLTAGSLRIKD